MNELLLVIVVIIALFVVLIYPSPDDTPCLEFIECSKNYTILEVITKTVKVLSSDLVTMFEPESASITLPNMCLNDVDIGITQKEYISCTDGSASDLSGLQCDEILKFNLDVC